MAIFLPVLSGIAKGVRKWFPKWTKKGTKKEREEREKRRERARERKRQRKRERERGSREKERVTKGTFWFCFLQKGNSSVGAKSDVPHILGCPAKETS